ncbi:hypothetical protein NPX13_g7349 [Xylaria arbuscula]|uniref:protein S-acyltransferase n=1 Tax=Xylaria arbuscula TaxID=114810 RepID=A0A9W8NAU8_9PEZI|nr:hypothetical protein NPX13_g7349 [Xylaria arbuscula]
MLEGAYFLLDKEIRADPGLVGGIFGHALSAAVFSGLIRSAQDIDNLGSEQKSINHQDAQGRSALHIAAWRGNPEVFQILRSKGADINLLDCQGRSVVHHAAIGGSVDILHQLLSDANTSRLNKTDDQGWLPLHWACRTEANRDAVSLLADKAGDSWAHIETQQCWTPESIAAFHNAIELIPEDKRTKKWGTGYCHWAYECDGCQQHPIYGTMFHYYASRSVDFCFKCALTRHYTYPQYDFETLPRGKSVETRPVVIVEERNIDSMGEDYDSY